MACFTNKNIGFAGEVAACNQDIHVVSSTLIRFLRCCFKTSSSENFLMYFSCSYRRISQKGAKRGRPCPLWSCLILDYFTKSLLSFLFHCNFFPSTIFIIASWYNYASSIGNMNECTHILLPNVRQTLLLFPSEVSQYAPKK